MARSGSVTQTVQVIQKFVDDDVKRSAKSAVDELDNESGTFLGAVETFIQLLRTKVRESLVI